MANWRVGMKVQCIADAFLAPECVANGPICGTVYTVRGFNDRGIPVPAHIVPYVLGIFPVGLLLTEIKNDGCRCLGGIERSFDEAGFRPIVEDEAKSKAVVEELKKLAAPIKTTEKVK